MAATLFAANANALDMKRDKQIKAFASYLTGFIKFIQYDDGVKYYNYCIAGPQELADAVSSASRYSLSDRAVNAYTVKNGSDIQKCHILFIANDNIQQISNIEDYRNTLTVSNAENFIRDYNGMIEIRENNDNYTFALNVEKLNEANFKVSSKLAELAENSY